MHTNDLASQTRSMDHMLAALEAGDIEAAYFWAWINRELWSQPNPYPNPQPYTVP